MNPLQKQTSASGDKLQDAVTHILPVVEVPQYGDIYVTAGTYTVSVPDGMSLMGVEVTSGEAYLCRSATGDETLPAPWPPAANVVDGSAAWVMLSSVNASQARDYAVAYGESYRLAVQDGAVVQVSFR